MKISKEWLIDIIIVSIFLGVLLGYLIGREAHASYTTEEFSKRVKEQYAPKKDTPIRYLFRKPVIKKGYTLFTSKDWEGWICRTKWYYNEVRKTECKEIK